MRPGSWAVAEKRQFVTTRKAFLSPWTGCDKKERDVVREFEVTSWSCERRVGRK